MIISPDFQQNFPLCARYIINFLSDPEVFKSKYLNVWNAFLKACTFELTSSESQEAEKFARQALTFGQEPWVNLIDSKIECGTFTPGPSIFQYPFQRAINISRTAADSYEHSTGWKVLEGTILHELVHWIRFNAAGTIAMDISSQGEIGKLFELWAYGFTTCWRSSNGMLLPIGPPGTEPK